MIFFNSLFQHNSDIKLQYFQIIKNLNKINTIIKNIYNLDYIPSVLQHHMQRLSTMQNLYFHKCQHLDINII